MWGWHDGWGAWGWALMTIGMVAFWGIVAWAVVSATRCRPWREPPPATPPPPITQRAEDILDERLARGDLDVDEYRRRRDALHAPRPPSAAT